MVPHRRILFLLVALPVALISACDKVPLLAPTGTTISILPATNTVSLNSRVQIVATAIQNGVASSSGSGTGATTTTSTGGQPVQNGTVISFTTTIGSIQPQEARTKDGQVSVTLTTGGQSGTATITAYSGGASSSVKLAVGTAAVSNIIVSATPASLGSAGGTAQVTAQVTDDGGSGISGVPVTFTTDQGTLTPSTATSDANGNATVSINTTATATVTAAAGAKTGTAKINVNPRSLTSISASPPSTTAGTPVAFAVTLGANANVSNVHIDFGDGSSTDLGSSTTTSHPYSSPGIYTVTATANDGSFASTQVTVGSLPVTLTPSSPTATIGTPISFTVGGVPSTTAVKSYVFTYDDGTVDTLTSPQDSHAFGSAGAHTARVDVIGLDGQKLGTTTATVSIT
jgi:hypothetical protein